VKFRVAREPLGEAVAWVARALPSRPVVPVLSGLLLSAAADGLTLSCFDYQVSALYRIDAEVTEPGTALVPGRLLAEIVRSLPGAPADFSGTADMVSLSCGSAEFALVALAADEYPALPEPPLPAGTVDGGVFAAAAAQVAGSASKDDTLPMLTGVCLDIVGEVMTLVATDRYRLAVSEIRWSPATAGISATALVPARTLADVTRTMTRGERVDISFDTGETFAASGDAAESVHSGGPAGSAQGSPVRPAARAGRPVEGMITFAGRGRRLTARLIGGEFIRYQSRFPAEFDHHAELAAEPFLAAIRRVSLVADRASPVSLTFRPGTVVIEAHADGRARAVESVPARFSGAEPVISFNPGYLLDGLTAAALPAAVPAPTAAAPAAIEPGAGRRSGKAAEPAADSGRIRFDFTSASKPALITWVGGQHGAQAPGPADGAREAPDAPEAGSGPYPASGGAGEAPADEGRPAADTGGGPAGPAAGAGASLGFAPAFRYLVVPVRAIARS